MPSICSKNRVIYITECPTFRIVLIIFFLCHLICWKVIHDGIDSERKKNIEMRRRKLCMSYLRASVTRKRECEFIGEVRYDGLSPGVWEQNVWIEFEESDRESNWDVLKAHPGTMRTKLRLISIALCVNNPRVFLAFFFASSQPPGIGFT